MNKYIRKYFCFSTVLFTELSLKFFGLPTSFKFLRFASEIVRKLTPKRRLEYTEINQILRYIQRSYDFLPFKKTCFKETLSSWFYLRLLNLNPKIAISKKGKLFHSNLLIEEEEEEEEKKEFLFIL